MVEIVRQTYIRMLSNKEATAISEAVSDGVAGVKFDHDLLKAIHLVLPLRDCMSFMHREGISKFPVCFLQDCTDCPVAKHTPEAFHAAVVRHRKGCRDTHLWVTLQGLDECFGASTLCDAIDQKHHPHREKDIDHDFATRRINNLRAILDPTSSVKHFMLCDDLKRDDVDS